MNNIQCPVCNRWMVKDDPIRFKCPGGEIRVEQTYFCGKLHEEAVVIRITKKEDS